MHLCKHRDQIFFCVRPCKRWIWINQSDTISRVLNWSRHTAESYSPCHPSAPLADVGQEVMCHKFRLKSAKALLFVQDSLCVTDRTHSTHRKALARLPSPPFTNSTSGTALQVKVTQVFHHQAHTSLPPAHLNATLVSAAAPAQVHTSLYLLLLSLLHERIPRLALK